jgi:hypothetical protein
MRKFMTVPDGIDSVKERRPSGGASIPAGEIQHFKRLVRAQSAPTKGNRTPPKSDRVQIPESDSADRNLFPGEGRGPVSVKVRW